MSGWLKSLVERYPALAFAYRTIRDEWTIHSWRPQSTPYGFRLIGNREMVEGSFEPEETALIRDYLREAEVFVDVGANIGFYTALARSLGKKTIAVEPLSQNLSYLYANLRENGWSDVEVWPLGLAESPGTGVLYGASTGASLIRGWAGGSPLLRRPIAISTLDILLGSRFNGRRLVIKIDVEGGEHEVLRGAAKTLEMLPRPVWLVEISLTELHPAGINRHYIATFEAFWQHGYEARTADSDRRPVSRSEVQRWLNLRARDFGTSNYIFTAYEG